MKQQIKNLRIHIDGLAQLTKELKPLSECGNVDCRENCKSINSKEIEKSVDSLYLAKAWLGKVLAELGEENPYKPGKKTIEDIEPTADTFKDDNLFDKPGYVQELWFQKGTSHIEKVDWLREAIQNSINSLPDFDEWHNPLVNEAHERVKKNNDGTIPREEWKKEMDEIPDWRREIVRAEEYLIEARFFLGFEMQRIRENEK